jgi:hypothetical protein
MFHVIIFFCDCVRCCVFGEYMRVSCDCLGVLIYTTLSNLERRRSPVAGVVGGVLLAV